MVLLPTGIMAAALVVSVVMTEATTVCRTAPPLVMMRLLVWSSPLNNVPIVMRTLPERSKEKEAAAPSDKVGAAALAVPRLVMALPLVEPDEGIEDWAKTVT